jgi:hypothetical protein
MSILTNFYSSRKMHTKRKGGAGDNECDICFESKTTFDKLNCKKCSDKGSKICKGCVGIIKIQKKNCPMCRGEIQHSFTSLRDKIAARKMVEEMEKAPVSPRRTPTSRSRVSPPRRIPTSRSRVSPRRTPTSRRDSPNTERANRTRRAMADNPVLSARTAASASSRTAISRNRI